MNRFVILLVALAAVAAAGRQSDDSSEFAPAISYSDYKKNPSILTAPNTSPEWLQWKGSDRMLPTDAVFAGFSPFGVSYIIRADHTTPEGIYIGKLIGKYFPYEKKAFVGHNGVEHEKTNFDLMLHNRPLWAEKGDRRPLMEGSNGNLICRVQHDNFWTPGRLDHEMRFCTYPWDGREKTSPNFQVLRRMC